jgi:hypothetical protein
MAKFGQLRDGWQLAPQVLRLLKQVTNVWQVSCFGCRSVQAVPTFAMPRSASWWMFRGGLPLISLKAPSPSVTHPAAVGEMSAHPQMQILPSQARYD